MADLYPQPYTTASPSITSYSMTEILSGVNYLTFYLGNSENNTDEEFDLSTIPFMPSSTDGLLNIGTYEFKAEKGNVGKILRGTCFLSGVTDATASSYIIKSTLLKKTGDLVLEGEGDINWSSDGEVTNSSSSYILTKTINIDDYVNKMTMEMKIQDAGGVPVTSSYIKYYYVNGATENGAIMTTGSSTYVEKTSTNPTQNKKVIKMELYTKGYSGGGTWGVKLLKVYKENVSNEPTAISDEITSKTMGADTAFLIKIPLNSIITLSPDDNLLLNLELSGTGKIVLDPNQTFNTDETTKLNIPFDLTA